MHSVNENPCKQFDILARGVALVDGRVLLARQIDATNTFLPGGHIGHGERAETALIREIEEEIGETAIVQRFLGAVEPGGLNVERFRVLLSGDECLARVQ